MKKLAAIAAAVGLALFSLTGCAQAGKASCEATEEPDGAYAGLSQSHTVHIAMTEFAEKVKRTHRWKDTDPNLPKWPVRIKTKTWNS